MDAINWSRSVFESIKQRYESFLENIGAEAVSIIPCSALLGDSIVQRSAHMPWYQGPTLIESLELPENDRLKPVDPFLYLTIQNTLRDPKKLTRRLYGVRVGGNHAVLKVGDEFESYPGKEMVRVLGLYVGEKSIHEAQPGQAVSVELDRDIGLTHGDWLLPPYETAYSLQNQLEVSVCWMNSKPMQAGKSVGLSGKYLAKIGSRTVWVKVGTTPSVFDWEQLDWQEKADVQLNDLARITLNFSESIPVRFFSKKGDKGLSSAILIDPTTYETVAAVWFDQPLNKLNKNVVSFEHLNRAASSPRLKE
jgi:sulfate adenylyltransferase subunit 1 (EFTu-like GTPase family)